MTTRYPILYRSVQAFALIMILIGLAFPSLLQQWELILAVSMIVLIGIPHGATDYLIFRHLTQPFLGTRKMSAFYLNYLLVMAAYSLLWWVSPISALLSFIVLSAYHFGQSNWNYLNTENKTLRATLYLSWGLLVTVTPILLHFEAAQPILTTILATSVPVLSKAFCWSLVLGILILNVWLLVYLRVSKLIALKEFSDEWITIALLMVAYYALPLLLGFTIYFVFFHSLSSVMDQIQFFRKQFPTYDWRKYVKHTFPLTLAALAGLALLVGLQWQMGIQPNVGLLFIFISIVTLPHMLLIDKLYEELEVPELHNIG
ncbi:MAG: Brp/Blh family beta-carotene 15,15'-dioxygenase [Bacteroidota bacterium]